MNGRQKILIVDDRNQNLYALEKVLQKLDAEVIRATCGNDALIAALNHEFALAILDVQMPEMDGYELAEYLRNDEKTRNLPIIFLTAVYSDEHHVFKGYEAGAVDFVTKPYQSYILLAKVRVFLQLDLQRRDLEKAIELEKTKNHLENILLSMSDAVMVLSTEERIQTINEAALSLLGYRHGDILGRSFNDLAESGTVFPWTGFNEKGAVLNGMENPTWHNIETCLLTKHRQAIPVLISGSAFHDKDNRRLGTVVVARDIRHRIRARKALKASEEKYRTLYETSRDGIAFSDMKGNLMDGNRAFLDMTGYTLPELMKMNYRQLRRESSCGRDDEFPNRQILHRGYSDENEKEYTRKDGTVFPVAVRSWLSRDEAGDPAGIWMLVRDITGQKALEQQRIMNEKMTALGMMAGGVAHELNNPMMGIGGFIEYCLKHTQKEDRRYEILEDAARETSRCVDLVKNLLTFSHTEQSSEEDYEWVECERLFDRVSRLLAHRIEKDRVLVTKQICEKSRRIYARANALQQVFLNLMTNALDAVKDVPKKEICFTVQPVQEDVLIRISDTGKGMEPDRKKRIFDPFFTTKPVGKGTGLGLSVTRSIVESLGGRVGCESEPGKGTRMDIVIPGKKDSK